MMRPTTRVNDGYSIVEMLVVVAIVIALATLLLMVMPKPKIAEVRRTEIIIQTVKVALELAAASKGSAISPTEHPFAGSQADAGGERFAFIRSDPSWLGPVAKTGTALKGVPHPGYLMGELDHLLMASDVYADKRIALLYGAKRQDIGVLQSQRKVVTKYRQLPMPPNSTTGSQPKVLSPRTGQPTAGGGYQGDLNADYPETLVPSQAQLADTAYGRLADSKSALDYLFGSSSAQAELASLKALYNADPRLPTEVNTYTTGIEARAVGGISEPLVFTNAGTGNDARVIESKWKPGFIPISGTGSTMTVGTVTSSRWARYRLAGLAVYDAWGNELITTLGAGGHRVISAGLDGVLAVAPGSNNSIDTDLSGDLQGNLPIDAKDLDGAKDNLQ